MDNNSAISSKYKTDGGKYFDEFKKEKGDLKFETLAEHNELYFADKGRSFYVEHFEKAFSPETFDKYDIRTDGNLQIGDVAPNCKVQILTKQDKNIQYKNIFDFCKDKDNTRPMVLNFGSYS